MRCCWAIASSILAVAASRLGWNYPANHIKTKLVTTVLNLDFDILLLLSRIGIHLPGLSLLSVCRLKGAGI